MNQRTFVTSNETRFLLDGLEDDYLLTSDRIPTIRDVRELLGYIDEELTVKWPFPGCPCEMCQSERMRLLLEDFKEHTDDPK